MKTVRFNVDFNGQLPQFKDVKAGTVMEVEDGHAKALIHRQVATEVTTDKPEPVKPEIVHKEEKVALRTKEEKTVKKSKKK